MSRVTRAPQEFLSSSLDAGSVSRARAFSLVNAPDIVANRGVAKWATRGGNKTHRHGSRSSNQLGDSSRFQTDKDRINRGRRRDQLAQLKVREVAETAPELGDGSAAA
jgi:hypothetical protein